MPARITLTRSDLPPDCGLGPMGRRERVRKTVICALELFELQKTLFHFQKVENGKENSKQEAERGGIQDGPEGQAIEEEGDEEDEKEGKKEGDVCNSRAEVLKIQLHGSHPTP